MDKETYVWNEGKSKDKLLKRMLKAYQQNKRLKKIEKLKDNASHWKGLQ